MTVAMYPADPYGADDDFDDLPPLPIPRPGEWTPGASSEPAPVEPRIAPPKLGGGASYTAASEDGAAPVADAPESVSPIAEDGRGGADAERFKWELAARLTSGMLANPSRNHSSVKDAMGLFDQFLQEMNAYSRITAESDVLGARAAQRKSHGEYFQQAREHARANDRHPRSAGPVPPVPSNSSAKPVPQQPTPQATPKAQPDKPRPMGNYAPIPPDARGPYAPGSQPGASGVDPARGEDERAA